MEGILSSGGTSILHSDIDHVIFAFDRLCCDLDFGSLRLGLGTGIDFGSIQCHHFRLCVVRGIDFFGRRRKDRMI